ncbi:MAG: FAD-dependent monooxygenase [Acidobacteriaceae bacterium]|nr:FAD-dependent monooxygenase [Acidobacteriaceae bacterium]
MRKTRPDVLVIGAGPVGLTMAAELARHGASCRIIDRLAEPLPYCRAIGITPRTLEVWDDMGIVRPMIDAGLWIVGTSIFLNRSPARYVQTELFDLPYGHLGIPQPETERILAEHLVRFGVAVERPVMLTSLNQDSQGVQVELLHSDNSKETAVFHYVVGCDGARSTVRRLLDIPFEGDHFLVGFMLGDVAFDCDLPRGVVLRAVRPIENAAPDFLVAVPLPERNRYRVSMLATSALPSAASAGSSEQGLQSEQPGPSIEELQIVADRLFPTKMPMSDLRWSSHFRIGMRLAARYREGRGFIAGDAAHIHPPTGGQGMNTGIQDAYNLAWKMALVLQGLASPDLLDSYESERRSVGAEVVSRTRAQSEQFGRQQAGQQERLIETQIPVNYRGGILSRETVSESSENLPIHAGDRAPDCFGLLRANVRSACRLFDITRGVDHVLLLYMEKFAEPRQIEMVENLTQKLMLTRGPKCRLVLICSPGAETRDVIGAATFTDSTGEFAANYAPGVNTGYAIRPDGYVGYHGRPITEHGFLDYLSAL